MTNVINFPATSAAVTAALPALGGAYNYAVGSKYAATKGMDIKDVAKLVRADIKASVAAGQVPAGSYTVKIHRFSGGQAIDVRGTVAGLVVREPQADGRSLYTEQARAIRLTLEAILGQYNYDRSDIQSDYHDNRFYGDVILQGA